MKNNRLMAITIAYYLSFLILGLFTSVEGPALPGLAENTSSALDQISLIFIFGSSGYMIGSFLGGHALDRIPGNRLIPINLLAMLLCALIVPLARQLWLLLFVLFLLGLNKGSIDVSGNTILLWTHGAKAGPYMNGLHFSFGFGTFFAPLILAGILSITGSPLWAYWFFGALCLPLAAWLWKIPEPASQPAPTDTGKVHFPLVPILFLIFAFVAYVGAEVGFGNWVYIYSITLGLGDTITAAYLTSAYWGAFTLGRLLGIWISTRVRATAILYADLFGCLISLGSVMLWSDSVVALWIGTIGLGFCMASVFPTILILAGERMTITGAITGWLLAGTGAGGMILPWAIGQAFTRFGAQTMPALVLIGVVANILAIALFVRHPIGKQQAA